MVAEATTPLDQIDDRATSGTSTVYLTTTSIRHYATTPLHRYLPFVPPVLLINFTSPITIVLSIALHMS